MTAKRFSEFDEVISPSGSEEIVGFVGNQNIRTRLDVVKQLVNKADVGLGNVDNTTDLNKPVSTATQSALNSKSNINHEHTLAEVTDLQSALDNKADNLHDHAIDDITGLQSALIAKSDISHSHTAAELPEIQTALNNKANSTHAHNVADITGLQSTLDGKAASVHSHLASDITDFTEQVEAVLQNAGIVAGDVSVENLEW